MKPGYSTKITDETRFSTGPGIMLTVLHAEPELAVQYWLCAGISISHTCMLACAMSYDAACT